MICKINSKNTQFILIIIIVNLKNTINLVRTDTFQDKKLAGSLILVLTK